MSSEQHDPTEARRAEVMAWAASYNGEPCIATGQHLQHLAATLRWQQRQLDEATTRINQIINDHWEELTPEIVLKLSAAHSGTDGSTPREEEDIDATKARGEAVSDSGKNTEEERTGAEIRQVARRSSDVTEGAVADDDLEPLCAEMLRMMERDADAAAPSAELREKLAEYAHEAWAGWMEYLFSKCAHLGDERIIPEWAVERWMRQLKTPYAELPESEKASDRAEADKMLAIMGAADVLAEVTAMMDAETANAKAEIDAQENAALYRDGKEPAAPSADLALPWRKEKDNSPCVICDPSEMDFEGCYHRAWNVVDAQGRIWLNGLREEDADAIVEAVNGWNELAKVAMSGKDLAALNADNAALRQRVSELERERDEYKWLYEDEQEVYADEVKETNRLRERVVALDGQAAAERKARRATLADAVQHAEENERLRTALVQSRTTMLEIRDAMHEINGTGKGNAVTWHVITMANRAIANMSTALSGEEGASDDTDTQESPAVDSRRDGAIAEQPARTEDAGRVAASEGEVGSEADAPSAATPHEAARRALDAFVIGGSNSSYSCDGGYTTSFDELWESGKRVGVTLHAHFRKGSSFGTDRGTPTGQDTGRESDTESGERATEDAPQGVGLGGEYTERDAADEGNHADAVTPGAGAFALTEFKLLDLLFADEGKTLREVHDANVSRLKDNFNAIESAIRQVAAQRAADRKKAKRTIHRTGRRMDELAELLAETSTQAAGFASDAAP